MAGFMNILEESVVILTAEKRRGEKKLKLSYHLRLRFE